MPDASLMTGNLAQLVPKQLIANFLSSKSTVSERTSAVKVALQSPLGQLLREQMAKRIIELLQVDYLVPEKYAQWRPLVQDAMFFMATNLSTARLAPKLIEQMDLPANTAPEVRLLRLIAKVPGLQKLGQVLARNRHLNPSLRNALSQLENGISDVQWEDVRAIILEELGSRLKACSVEMEPAIFCEASVSAVVRFSWTSPKSKKRERGVFKVMKPYIPACFAEDMQLLGKLAKFLGAKHREYQIAARGISDTFQEVRQLLRHEVHFLREQATLRKASRIYRSVPGVRVPQAILALCTSKITAMSEERGEKVTSAIIHMPAWRRAEVSRQLVEALIAVPLSVVTGKALFHADPHAGNLLYDKETGELILLDWALTEQLSRDQRRHLALMFVMLALRDPVGVSHELQALSYRTHDRQGRKLIRDQVNRFIDQLPLTRMPGAVDAMRLVETVAYEGVRFPAPLIMLRKVTFTLDGILHDIAETEPDMEFVIARQVLQNWVTNVKSFGSPLYLRDWIRVHLSTLFYGGRLWVQGAQKALERSRPTSVPAV